MRDDPRRNTSSDAIDVAQMRNSRNQRAPLKGPGDGSAPYKHMGKKETKNI